MEVLDPTTTRRRSEEGFTLLELVIAMLVASIALVALAGAFASGLRTVAIDKTRTTGNEIATEGIEDLQRYSYDYLGTCGAMAPNPPAGFETTATLPNCSGVTMVNPCGGSTNTSAAPQVTYTCTRRGIAYTVNRFISYGDATQTSKRLAVVVRWTDAFGRHEVAQQSSLRSPNKATTIGVSPPSVTTLTMGDTYRITATNRLEGDMTISLTTQGLLKTDSVVAVFNVVEGGGVVDKNRPMTSPDGINWATTIGVSEYQFAHGSQFFRFNVVRASDGKANSRVAPRTKFCGPQDGYTCSGSLLPQITPTTPPTADIDAGGALLADIPVSAATKNVASTDRVYMVFQTQAGSYSMALSPDPATTCTTLSCTWTGKISKSAGYRFYSGPQKFYFTATQAPTDPSAYPLSAAVASNDVVFS